MQQKQRYYKSDFSAILDFDGGWESPFKLKFWTNSPSRSFTASYDGTTYTNCQVATDGRLLIAFDSHNMGLGTLMLQPEFYLTDEDYADGICDEVITPFAPTFTDDEGVEYTLALGLTGASTIETVGTLPAYYQKGDKGDKGDQGIQGIQGEAGKDGADGKDGKDGADGKDGTVIYPSFNIDSNGHLQCIIPTTEAEINVTLKDGHLILTVA